MLYKASADVVLDSFLRLPRKAQFLFFDKMIKSTNCEKNPYIMFDVIGYDTNSCKSPIEQILMFAFNIRAYERNCDIDLEPQKELIANGNRYFADLYYTSSENKEGAGFSLIVECDGHDYHQKTKQQAQRDYEREYNLKKAGYDIIRFTGTQIFCEPYECADKIIDYILDREGVE